MLDKIRQNNTQKRPLNREGTLLYKPPPEVEVLTSYLSFKCKVAIWLQCVLG